MVRFGGPANWGSEQNGCCGNYSAKRVKGIEPSSVAWKATALPLSYTRVRVVQVAAPAGSCQVLFPWHRHLPIPAVASSTLLCLTLHSSFFWLSRLRFGQTLPLSKESRRQAGPAK